MVAVIQPQRWLRPPHGFVEVDWSHPLARGLIAAVPLNLPVVYEAVRMRRPTSVVSAPVFQGSERGAAWRFDGTDDEISFDLGKAYSLPFTLLAMQQVDATSDVFANTAQKDVFFCLRSAASIYEAVGLGLNNNAGGWADAAGLLLDNTAGSGEISGNNSGTNLWTVGGQWRGYGASFLNSTDRRVYLNGRLDYTQSMLSKDPQVTHLSVGCSYASVTQNFYSTGASQALAAYNRALSDAEHRAWFANPWQMYRPWARRRYFFVAGGGGAVTLVVADCAHGHAADNVVLASGYQLTAQDATHSHAADNVVLASGYQLAAQDAAHAHAADSVTLSSSYVLAVADALHSHAADQVTLAAGISLAPADTLHGHAADNLVLSSAYVLTVQDATHGHAADQVTLSSAVALTVADALHGHAADPVTLTHSYVLSVADSLHAHLADQVTLTGNVVLVVSDTLHAHLADAIFLSIPGEGAAPARRVIVIEARGRTLIVAPSDRSITTAKDRTITVQ